MSNIRFNPVTPDGIGRLEELAQDFNHSVMPPLCPLVEIRDGDRLIGYFSVFNRPILFPAFHPKMTTPRNFLDAASAMINWQRLNSMGPTTPQGVAHIALPLDARSKYETSVFEKFGVVSMESELYGCNT